MKSFLKVLLIFPYLMTHFSLLASTNFESMAQDFVLETTQIHIPGYPHAFNPCIVRWRGSLLMSFRILPDLKQTFTSRIGLVWLNEQFIPIGKPQLLETTQHPTIPPRTEDPRLIVINDQLWMVYADNKNEKITRGTFRVYVASLDYDGEKFSISYMECLNRFDKEDPLVREKNWSPFVYQDNLFLEYSLSPHHILRPLLKNGECETYASTNRQLPWDWGILRGGTPALIHDNCYLSFFHSSKDLKSIHTDDKLVAHYFIGAYTFNLEPPFEIKEISPEPIMAPNFFSGDVYKPYWKPVKAIFPCGFVMDDDFIWISYGKHDHEAWIVKIDKAKLLKSLIPIPK